MKIFVLALFSILICTQPSCVFAAPMEEPVVEGADEDKAPEEEVAEEGKEEDKEDGVEEKEEEPAKEEEPGKEEESVKEEPANTGEQTKGGESQEGESKEEEEEVKEELCIKTFIDKKGRLTKLINAKNQVPSFVSDLAEGTWKDSLTEESACPKPAAQPGTLLALQEAKILHYLEEPDTDESKVSVYTEAKAAKVVGGEEIVSTTDKKAYFEDEITDLGIEDNVGEVYDAEVEGADPEVAHASAEFFEEAEGAANPDCVVGLYSTYLGAWEQVMKGTIANLNEGLPVELTDTCNGLEETPYEADSIEIAKHCSFEVPSSSPDTCEVLGYGLG